MNIEISQIILLLYIFFKKNYNIMWNTEKKINKWLIWIVIWTAAVWWLASTKKWKEITKQSGWFFKDKVIGFIDFVKWWLEWLKESMIEKPKIDSKNTEIPE